MINIKVILGENGQGKTRLLLDYYNTSLHSSNIAVISNAITNPFPRSNSSSHFLGNALRRGLHPEFINSYVLDLLRGNSLRGLLDTCALIGFEDEIMIRREPLFRVDVIEGKNENMPSYFLNYAKDESENRRLFKSTPRRLRPGYVESYGDFIVNHRDFYFGHGDETAMYTMLDEHITKEKEALQKMGGYVGHRLFVNKVYVKKDGRQFLLQDASSGELYMFTLGLFLTKYLGFKSDLPKLILIDEPENSLHPKLQKKFIEFFVGLIGLGEHIDIIIATHSPFITMESKFFNVNFELLGIDNGLTFKKNHKIENNNIEQVYHELFGVLTPKNRYLSEYCNDLLRNVAEKKTTFREASNALDAMLHVAFDRKQYDFLEGVKALLNKINGDFHG